MIDIAKESEIIILREHLVSLQIKHESLQTKYAELLESEHKLSDAYLRIRGLVGAWDTNYGGEDRFEVTENRVRELLETEKKYNTRLYFS